MLIETQQLDLLLTHHALLRPIVAHLYMHLVLVHLELDFAKDANLVSFGAIFYVVFELAFREIVEAKGTGLPFF